MPENECMPWFGRILYAIHSFCTVLALAHNMVKSKGFESKTINLHRKTSGELLKMRIDLLVRAPLGPHPLNKRFGNAPKK